MESKLFDLRDLLIGANFLLLVIVGTIVYGWFVRDRKEKLLFSFNIIVSVTFAVAYGVAYYFYYGGGDTFAYWDGAIKLNNLLFYDPGAYIDEMLTTSIEGGQYKNFNSITGYPPPWIYREGESFFVSKIFSFLGLLTFNSYVATSIVIGFISGVITWKFYKSIAISLQISHWKIGFSILFIPSVSFWCNGISKDTLLLLFLFLFLIIVFNTIGNNIKFNWQSFFKIMIVSYLIFSVRPFMLIAILIPLAIVLFSGVLKRIAGSRLWLLYFLRLSSFVFIVTIVMSSFQFLGVTSINNSSYVKQAVVTHNDFKENKTYKGKRYSIGLTDSSVIGIISTFPLAIFAAFYRPLIFEANNLFFLLTAIEGSIFLMLSILLFFKNKGIYNNGKYILSNTVLSFSLYFCLIYGFIVGFTSILLGVLVRFKAPLLPFLLLILLAALFRENK